MVGCLVAIHCVAFDADACAIPVFRYALERWHSDLFEVDLFYRGTLSPEDRAVLSALEDRSLVNGGTVNLEVIRCDLDQELDRDLREVWENLGQPELPYIAVRAPGGRSGSPVVWHGALNNIPAAWGDTAVERELMRRILEGDSIVWVVLTGSDAAGTDKITQEIEAALPGLTETIPLPPGIGLPGSQLMSPIPLEIRFSVLTVSPDDVAASWLRRIAVAKSREPIEEGETLVVPVFGRGRALTALKPADIDPDSLEELSRFLCGACSCQAKELNPGFDLLLSVLWDEQLFDPDAVPIAEVVPIADSSDQAAEPEFLSIPSGTAEIRESDPESTASIPATTEPAPTISETPSEDRRWLWSSVAIVAAVYIWRRGRNR